MAWTNSPEWLAQAVIAVFGCDTWKLGPTWSVICCALLSSAAALDDPRGLILRFFSRDFEVHKATQRGTL